MQIHLKSYKLTNLQIYHLFSIILATTSVFILVRNITKIFYKNA